MNNPLFAPSYGVYVLSARETGADRPDNACIINTFMQVTSGDPTLGVIAVNKQNYTHNMLVRTGLFNLSVLTTDADFELIKHFGFQTGRTRDKVTGFEGLVRGANGLLYLEKSVNAFLSFTVEEIFDFGTHSLFRARLGENKSLGLGESLTYSYYQRHVKPHGPRVSKPGFKCRVCSYLYEGESLPANFICPLCKHGASEFEKV